MKNMHPGHLIFSLWLVLSLAGLFACTTTDSDTISHYDRTLDPDPEGTREWPTATDTEESRIDERPIARGGKLDTPSELYPGHPVSYYEAQFKRMGYRIQDVDVEKERLIYDLRKGDILYEVFLILPEAKTHVQRLEWKQFRRITTDPRLQTEQTRRIREQVSQLSPGKEPTAYMPALDRLGTITHYQVNTDQAVFQLQVGRHRYEVAMDINPETQKVTAIEMGRYFWQEAG